jgi:hypothetical protein
MIDLEAICNSFQYKSWEKIKEFVNKETGFFVASAEEKEKINIAYPTAKINFSLKNIVHAVRLQQRHTNIIISGEIEFIKSGRLILATAGGEVGITNVVAIFSCPSCSKEYKVDLQPTRGLNKDSLLCKSCQKKYLHRCDDYRENYENAMLKKYNVKRPLQHKLIQDKFYDTMQTRYQVNHSVHNPSSIQKRDKTMIARYGKSNFWQGINPWDEFNLYGKSAFKHGVSEIEKRFVKEIKPLFANMTICDWEVKQKRFKRSDKPGYGYLDFYAEDIKLGVEFYGDYFHINPEIYSKEYVSDFGINACDKWYDDALRIKDAQSDLESIVLIVWEKEWKKSPEDVLKRIQEVVDERSKNYKLL